MTTAWLRTRAAVLVVALAAAFAGTGPASGGQDRGRTPDLSETLLLVQELAGDNGVGGGQVDNSTCTTFGDPAGNVDLSCDQDFGIDDETPIVVDPLDPNHLLAGSNDYHLKLVNGGFFKFTLATGFFVSFDGGSTWTDGQVPRGSGGGFTGDPAPAFDARHGTAHMAQIAGGCGRQCGHISVSVSTSRDGGVTWGNPVSVAQGAGSLTPSARGVFHDKPWLTADNNPASPYYGRLYLAWVRFLLDPGYVQSPVLLSVSDDAGATWSVPREISGTSAVLCSSQAAGPSGECDEDQFAVPVVLPDGTVVVHFTNSQNPSLWESPFELDGQLLVVRSTDGGTTWSGPVFVADLEDGLGDYPSNVDGRITQTGHQFRTQSAQGMTADPVNGDLYVFWSDNRDGVRETETPVTSTNVFLARSTDGGLTWSAPIRVTSGPGDRWMPWAGARDGAVSVMYMDGSIDPARDLYGIELASSPDAGATWSYERIDTAPSDPDHARFFRAGVEGCELCSTFIGDYNGLAVDSLGRTHVVWTDFRREITINNRTGHIEDAMYARR